MTTREAFAIVELEVKSCVDFRTESVDVTSITGDADALHRLSEACLTLCLYLLKGSRL